MQRGHHVGDQRGLRFTLRALRHGQGAALGGHDLVRKHELRQLRSRQVPAVNLVERQQFAGALVACEQEVHLSQGQLANVAEPSLRHCHAHWSDPSSGVSRFSEAAAHAGPRGLRTASLFARCQVWSWLSGSEVAAATSVPRPRRTTRATWMR